MLLSETGPFSIPVRCRTKKCQVKLDQTHLDFEKVCVGEVVRRQLTLYNTGALSTNFMISRSHAGQEPSLVVKSVESEESKTVSGKLTDRSDASVRSDFGMYGRPVEEVVRIGSMDYSTKSKSVGTMGDTDDTATSTADEQGESQTTTGKVIVGVLATYTLFF